MLNEFLKEDNYNLYLELHENLIEMREKMSDLKSDIDSTTQSIRELTKKCNHKHEDGTSAIYKSGYDYGSGKNEHSCSICFNEV